MKKIVFSQFGVLSAPILLQNPLKDWSANSLVSTIEIIRLIYWGKAIVAGLDDQTTGRVSGGVIAEKCVHFWASVKVCGHKGPSLPPLSNHRVDLWTPQGGCESPTAR